MAGPSVAGVVPDVNVLNRFCHGEHPGKEGFPLIARAFISVLCGPRAVWLRFQALFSQSFGVSTQDRWARCDRHEVLAPGYWNV